QLRRREHALRTADLPLHPRPLAGPLEALRYDNLGDLETPRHRASRLLDDGDRRFEPDTLLFPQMGISRRPREEVECIPVRSRMGQCAYRDREERCHCRARRESDPAADQFLISEVEIIAEGTEDAEERSSSLCSRGPVRR